MATKKKELLEQENSAPETTVPVENTPSPDETQADMATPADGGDLNELLASCEEYMLPKQIALQIIGEVLVAVKDWQILATQLGIAKNEQKQFSTIFEHNLEIYDSK